MLEGMIRYDNPTSVDVEKQNKVFTHFYTCYLTNPSRYAGKRWEHFSFSTINLGEPISDGREMFRNPILRQMVERTQPCQFFNHKKRGSQADSLLVVMFQVCWSYQISAFWCSRVSSRSTDRAPRTLPGCPVAKASPPRQLGPWMLNSDLQHSVFGAINGAMFGTRCEPLARPSEVGMAVVIMAGPFYSMFPGVMLDADTQSMATKRSQDENSYLC